MVFSNWMSIGCTIAYLHDIADIFAGLAKYCSQTRSTIGAVFALFTLIGVWAYTRIYLLPLYLYQIWTEILYSYPAEYEEFIWVNYGAAVMLTAMQILHIYWF